MRYCTLTVNERLKLKSNEEYIEAFQEVFQKAVDDRLRTHLNVGAQLSGGLDSGAVVSLQLIQCGKRVNGYIPSAIFRQMIS